MIDEESHHHNNSKSMRWQYKYNDNVEANKKPKKALDLDTNMSTPNKQKKWTGKPKGPKSGHWYVHFLSKQTTLTQSEKQKQTQQMNERTVKNLPKSKLKRFLAGKKSFGSKSVNSGDEGEREQPTVNIVMANKQRRQENTKWEKVKKWTKWVEPYYL